MIRVVHLDTGPSWRGGQQQVYLLHRELLRRGVESRLLCARGGALLARCRGEGIPAEPLPGRRWWNPAVVAAALRSARGAGILHAHDGHAATLAALVRVLRTGPELVCHRRVSYPLKRNPLSRWRYRRVDRWIAVSGEVAESLRRWGVASDRIRVVHSAIDLESLRADGAAADCAGLRAALKIPPEAPVVGCAAAFSPQKGHAVLVRAAETVLRSRPGVVFLLPGDGDTLETIRAEVEVLGLTAAFRFPGFRRDVSGLTRLFTVAVVPSVDGEGSSASIKEPMALGVPTVASDLPGNLEVLGDAGLSFPNRDVQALAGALERLLEDEALRADLGRRAARRAERFAPASMVDAVLGAYREVAG